MLGWCISLALVKLWRDSGGIEPMLLVASGLFGIAGAISIGFHKRIKK